MKNTKTCDLCVGIVFIGLGAWVIHLASQLQTVARGIGPRGYPTVVAALMIVLGLAQVVRSLYGGMPKFSFTFDKNAILKIAAVIILAFVYVALLRHLGFLLLTPFFLFLLMLLFGYKKYLTAAVASVCVSTATWVVFAKIFMIFLPEFSL